MALDDVVYTLPFKGEKSKPHANYDEQKEEKLTQTLKDIVKNLDTCLIRYSNFNWLQHRTNGKRSYINSHIVAIPWNRS